MSDRLPFDSPAPYQIRIKNHLDDHWADWFEGLTITREPNGETLLCGIVTDQAALYGLLKKVRDMGLGLISVSRVEYDAASQMRTREDETPPHSNPSRTA